MLRWLTAGESHGPELIAVLEGLPAGVPVSLDGIREDLARRKLGYGRGSRMKFEQDELHVSGGVVQGVSIGGPVAIRIGNTEWPKWTEVMNAEQTELTEKSRGRGAPLGDDVAGCGAGRRCAAHAWSMKRSPDPRPGIAG